MELKRVESVDKCYIVKTFEGLYIGKEKNKYNAWFLTRDKEKALKHLDKKNVKKSISVFRQFWEDFETLFIVEEAYYRVSSDGARCGFVEKEDFKGGKLEIHIG